MWDSARESHYTEQECVELDFEDVVNGISIEFQNGTYLDELTTRLGDIDEESIELSGVDTDDGTLYFNVKTEDREYIDFKVEPINYGIDCNDSVSLEDICNKDNDKLINLIKEECEID